MKPSRLSNDLWILGTVLALAAAGGCASPGKKTAIGAGSGAAGGAIIGAVAGGPKGAAIGAAAGAVAGGAVGNYLDKQAQELEKVTETKRTEEGLLVQLKNDLLFDTGKSALKPEASQQLAQLGAVLVKYPDDQIRIEGYTDSTGKETTNQVLSRARAESVRGALLQAGVKPAQLASIGLGENKPVASNKSSDGRAKNRRVELHIQVPEEAKS